MLYVLYLFKLHKFSIPLKIIRFVFSYQMPHQDAHVIFFDLETTGFDKPIQPVQIGAIGNINMLDIMMILL